MSRLSRLLRALFHQSLIAQGVTALAALVTVGFLARGLSTIDYAHYAVVTAIWGIGNAVVGTGTGTRIAKMSAQGTKRISFQRSELWITFLAAAITGYYIFFVRNSLVEATLAGFCMVSFVFAEASTSFEMGARRFNRYLVLLGVRALTPPVVLTAFSLSGTLDFTTAVVTVLAGNMISLLIWPSRWTPTFEYNSPVSSHAVGAMNMGLWIIASADRLVLERTITALDLASYALVYGLTDRIFRSLSNAYIAKNLGRAFQGETKKSGWKFYVLSLLLAALLVPIIQFATAALSGSRYNAPLIMTSLIVVAGLFMLWSAPHYVKLMASGEFKSALVLIFALAAFNVLANILLAAYLGTDGAAMISMMTYGLWFTWLATKRPLRAYSRLDGGRHVKVSQKSSHSSRNRGV